MTPRARALVSSAAGIVLGFILFQVNSVAAYCARHPGSTPGMRAPDGCLVEPSALAVVLGNIGFWMFLLGIIGVVVTAVLEVRAALGLKRKTSPRSPRGGSRAR